MFYALFVDNFNDVHVVGEGTTVSALLDSMNGKFANGNEVIIVQRVKAMRCATETVWKEAKGK